MRKVDIASLMAFLIATVGAAVHGAAANTPTVKVTCFDGAWSSKTTYGPGVVVSYNGANYLSLVTNTNDSPLSSFADWSILDASAAKGPACPQGPVNTTGGATTTPGGGAVAKAPAAPNVPRTPVPAAKPPGPNAPPVAPTTQRSPQNLPAATSFAQSPTRNPSASPKSSAKAEDNVIKSVSIYDSPAVPDLGGHSILGGLLTGKGFTAILPNLKVCVRPQSPDHAKKMCTEICKPGHQCLNQHFASPGVQLGSSETTVTVDIIDVDRPGSEHLIVTFNMSPATCADPVDARTSSQCKFSAPNVSEPSLSGSVQIGFQIGMNACKCTAANDPFTPGSWNSARGKQLTTKYAQVWTHYCAGKTLDGIVFKLFGGQIAPPNFNGVNTEQCSADQSNIIQFVKATICDEDGTCPGTKGLVGAYAVGSSQRTSGKWYLDTWRKPTYLGPELFTPDGAHLVDDEPSVQFQASDGKNYPRQVDAVDFVMCGAKIAGTIKWKRTGVVSNDPTPNECPGQSRVSNYDVEVLTPENLQGPLQNQLCKAEIDARSANDKAYLDFHKSLCSQSQ
jgi:hypothetical protein